MAEIAALYVKRGGAYWDEKAGRKEEFASALFFEAKAHMEKSEQLHWALNREKLEKALAFLKEQTGRIRDRLKHAEDELDRFRADSTQRHSGSNHSKEPGAKFVPNFTYLSSDSL